MSVPGMTFYSVCENPVAFGVFNYESIKANTIAFDSNHLARSFVSQQQHYGEYRPFGFWRIKGTV